MRTISGKVVSSEAISLTRAASILSNFVTSDHGSSHAVRSYLRRTCASFDDLVHLHKDLKSDSQVKHKKRKRDKLERSVIDHDLSNEAEEYLGKNPNKEKRERGLNVIGEVEDGGNVEAKKKKKKRKSSEV